jgi:hypothetical protein
LHVFILFQVIEQQTEKLIQAIADVKRQQYLFENCKSKCQDTLSAAFQRQNQAVPRREQQLRKQLEDAQMPLAAELQKKGSAVGDWQTMAAANKSLVSEMLHAASDVNLLQMSGTLAARSARLAAEVTRVGQRSANDQLVLEVDQHDVLEVEEILQGLGSLDFISFEHVCSFSSLTDFQITNTVYFNIDSFTVSKSVCSRI